MKISGIGPNNRINAYNESKNESKKETTRNIDIQKSDSIYISKEARNLSAISKDNNVKMQSSPERLEEVKNQISSGTYKADAKLIAKKIVDIIKGRNI